MNKILALLLPLALIFMACDEEVNDWPDKGETFSDFSISGPENSTKIGLNSGTPNETVRLEWEKPEYGTKPITYTVVFDTEEGDFSAPFRSIPSANDGEATWLDITHLQLDEVAGTAGANPGETVMVQWTVLGTNGDVIKQSRERLLLELTRFDKGLTAYSLLEPIHKTTWEFSLLTSAKEPVLFKWEPTTPVGTEGEVTYKWLAFDAEGDLTTPIFEMDADNEGKDPQKSFTQEELVELLDQNPAIEEPYALLWAVEAKVNGFTLQSKMNQVYIEVERDIEELYIVGSATSIEWDVANALKMSKEGVGRFSIVTELTAGGEFKFVTGQAWPPETIAFGLKDGNISTDPSASNFPGPDEDGLYLVTIDIVNNTWSAVKDLPSLYVVGDATSAGWNTENALEMSKVSAGKFAIITELDPAGCCYKFILNKGVDTWHPQWGGSEASGGTLVPEGEEDPPGIPAPDTKGLYRIVADFGTMTYTVEPWSQDELYLVGGSSAAGWDPPSALPLEKIGNGRFAIITDLTVDGSGFKFLPTNVDYEGDWGDKEENNTSGEGTLVQEGEFNCVVAEDGTYRIEVDFVAMKYFVTKFEATSLYVIGDATTVGWVIEEAIPFTEVETGKFTLTTDLAPNNDQGFKFTKERNWDISWGTDASGAFEQGGLVFNGGNIPAPSAEGSYTIDVNFVANTYTVTQQ